MRRNFLLILCTAVISAFSLASCGNNNEDSTSKTASSSSEEVSLSQSEQQEFTLPEDSVTDSETTAGSDITPAMWEVTCDNGAVVTLTGSMHALKQSD